MATLADFFPYVLPYVHGCSMPLAEQQIRDICRDFCAVAPIAQVMLDPLDAIAGEREYDIEVPPGSETTLILSAWYQGNPLAILKTGDRNDSGYGQNSGTPTGLQQALGNLFMLDMAPSISSAGAITMLVATKPTRVASTVPDVLLNDYSYEIGQGAVGRLMKLPGHKFSNPRDAAAYSATYLVAQTDARIRAESSFGAAPSRARYRSFE